MMESEPSELMEEQTGRTSAETQEENKPRPKTTIGWIWYFVYSESRKLGFGWLAPLNMFGVLLFIMVLYITIMGNIFRAFGTEMSNKTGEVAVLAFFAAIIAFDVFRLYRWRTKN